MNNENFPWLLVVDDDDKNIHSTKRILEGININVQAALSGEDALKAIINQKFFLILMDVQMPGMDGFETVSLIRGSEKYKNIPIIFLTALSKEDKYIQAGYETGAVDYMFKPIDKQMLISKVNVFLELHQERLKVEQGFEKSEGIRKELLNEIEGRKMVEEELIAANKATEKANRLMNMFLSNMSHEIRTPMNAILGFTEILLDDQLTDDHRESLEIIQQSAESLLLIINDLLDLSKVEAGKIDLEEIPFDIEQVVDGAIKLISSKSQEKSINLHYHIDKNLVRSVVGDPTRLRQILLNLLNNAIKFTDKGAVELSVQERTDTPSQDANIRLSFAIKDSGCGIAAENLDKIFSVFTQAETSTTRKYGGTGLGLAISKNLVDLMGGDIIVESTEGVGTTFTFDIIVKPDPADVSANIDIEVDADVGVVETVAPANTQQENDIPMQIPPPTSSYTSILIAEDDAMNRKLISKFLESVQCQIEFAVDGEEAVKMAGKNQYDLIFMDMNMPKMNGLEATCAIRKQSADSPQTPIIGLTADAMKGTREKCLEAGMNDYLTKPIRKELLCEAIGKYSGRSRGEMELTPFRLLLVDDDENFSETLCMMFQNFFPGATIKSANGGIQACAYLGSFLPHLIVLDVNMPEMNGVALATFILNDSRYNSSKIMVATGCDENNPEIAALKALGVTEIFNKANTSVDELVQSARRLLEEIDERSITTL